MYDIQKIREDFPILSRTVYGKPLIYLDNGATTQQKAPLRSRINYRRILFRQFQRTPGSSLPFPAGHKSARSFPRNST